MFDEAEDTTRDQSEGSGSSTDIGRFQAMDTGIYSTQKHPTTKYFLFFNESKSVIKVKPKDQKTNRNTLFHKKLHFLSHSRYYSFRPALSPEKELEMLMGQILHGNFLSEGMGKEFIFNRIIELLSKPKNQNLRRFHSKIHNCSVIELAMDHNNAGALDYQIAILKKLGCSYRYSYELKLPLNLRQKETSPPQLRERQLSM